MSTTSVATFDFRINHERYTAAELVALLPRVAKKWTFQGEIGRGDNAYHHWQGRLSLHTRRLPTVGKDLILARINCNYVRPTSTACHRRGAMFYVLKDDTYDGQGRFSDTDVPTEPLYVPRQHRVAPRPWQQAILDSGEEWCPRTINVLVDHVGGIGKSIVAGLARARGYITIPVCGDAERLIYSVCSILRGRGLRTPKLVILDLPRSIDKKKLAQFMITIEEIKNGYVYDSRHSFKEWAFDSPALWVFSNSDVPSHYVSNDRWKIWHLVNDELVRRRSIESDPLPFWSGEMVDLSDAVAEYKAQ